MFRSFLIAMAAVVFLAPYSHAAKVKVWHQGSQANYEKAQLKGAVVSNEGTLHLSRQLKPLAGLDATHVWDVIEDKAGNLLLATGDEGKIFKVTPDGKVTVIYSGEDSQVLCLALAADGSVYAGTGPTGRIVRISKEGKASVFYTTKQEHILCMAQAGDGALYAGTDK